MTEKEKYDKDDYADGGESSILEQGDIYFFYRPKKDSTLVKDKSDVRRFFMVTAADHNDDEENKIKTNQNKKDIGQRRFYRLFVIGKKSLPEIRKSEARASERYWARVGGLFENEVDLTKELFADEFRKGDIARPVGLGKYFIVKHQNHAELAYILEIPDEPKEAQKELGIEKEASYIISVINPKRPVPPGFPSAEEHPRYPDKILNEFDEEDQFISLSKDTRLIDYLNAQIILIGAREGHDTLKKDLGIDVDERKLEKDSDIFNKLKLKKAKIPIKPLFEGKLE